MAESRISSQHLGTQRQASPQEHAEGPVARAIEQQTARMPSDLFLWAAGGSIAASLLLQLFNKQHASLFVGQWVPTFLILGLYNKIVKVAGSDRTQAAGMEGGQRGSRMIGTGSRSGREGGAGRNI